MKAEWFFIWMVATYDILFFWQHRNSAPTWEQNTIAVEIYKSTGFIGVLAVKVSGLIFAMFLSRIRPKITHFAAAAYFALACFYMINLYDITIW